MNKKNSRMNKVQFVDTKRAFLGMAKTVGNWIFTIIIVLAKLIIKSLAEAQLDNIYRDNFDNYVEELQIVKN